MKRLVYTLERVHNLTFGGAFMEDAIVGLTMASLGLPGIERRIDNAADLLEATLSFPDDKSLLRFNLRVERALALRGVKIRKIHIAETYTRRDNRRAVA
jgi:hypothetical protein